MKSLTLRYFVLVTVILTCLIVPRWVRAGASTPDGESDNEPLLRSAVNLVTIYATVSDPAGRFVAGLKPDNFEVYDNGLRQNIEYFSQEERPLTIGIVFDTSASMKERMTRSIEAMQHFLNAQRKDDEYFLITFNTSVNLMQDFTTAPDDIIAALKDVNPCGMTALHDGIFAGVEKVKQGHNSKRVLLVISDGQDNSSWYNSKELSKILQEADVQIFTISLPDEIASRSPAQLYLDSEGRAALKHFSETSGGRSFFPSTLNELDTLLVKVNSELRNQYSIGFSPSTGLDGRWHKLQVKVKDEARIRLAVRSRTGYQARGQ
jgi:Ca-activated chloride channel homolog